MDVKSLSQMMSAEEALRVESAVLAWSMNAIVLADLQGRLIYVNPAFLRLWRCEETDVLGRPAGDFWQQPEQAAAVIASLQEPGGWEGEITALRLDGSLFEAQISASLVRDSDGKPLCMMGIFRDITPYKQIAEELRHYARQLDERVKELHVMTRISELAEDLDITVPAFLQRVVEIIPTGWRYAGDACALIMVGGQRYTTANYRETAWQQWGRIMAGGQELGRLVVGYLKEHPAGDAEIFLPEERTLLDEVARLIGRFLQRKHAEQALLEGEERYRDLFENSPIALFEQDFSAVKRRFTALGLSDPQQFRLFLEMHPEVVAECVALVRILTLNQASLGMYGAKDKAELLIGLDRLVPPEGHQLFIDELVWIAEGRTSFAWEGVNRKLSGELINIRLHWSAVPGCEETLTRVLVAIEDVTARAQAEAALQASETRYRVVSELTSDFAYTLAVLPDGSLQTEWITGAFTRITGFAEADLEAYGGWVNLFHPDDRGRVQEEMERLLAGRASIVEARMKTREGPARWIRFHNRPESDPQTGRICRIRGAGQDITETKRMEQEVIQAERLAAMGQVMAILAHEIKNPLQAIQGNLDLLSAYELEPDEREETLRICRSELRRLTDITQGVLSLSRAGPETYRPVAVAQAWQQTMDLVSKQMEDSGIEIAADLPADLPPIQGSMEQVIQVLLNLALNAIESMPTGGRLEVTGSRQGNTVVVAVTDNGPSIPEDHLDRLVEPFFTTKAEGTGLGLFVSHTIVQQHGGSLIATNLPDNQGVRFSIILPVAAVDPTP